jgi:hypothetical protein
MTDDPAPIQAEHWCIKCNSSGHDDDMVALHQKLDGLFHHHIVAAWVHQRCLGDYITIAAPFEMNMLRSKMSDRDGK